MSEKTKILYFPRARTALKFGLKILGLNPNDHILIPDFICESIFQPITQNSLNFSIYGTSEDMKPVWPSLETKVNSRTRAILMVHYFGQPQDIEKFLNFSRKHQLFLVEDNAHGHGGSFKGKELGTFGHIGISSPRKILNIEDGGLLYLNSSYEEDSLPVLNYQEQETNEDQIREYLNKFPVAKHKLKLFLKKRPKYENPRAFRESYAEDLYLSRKSSLLIDSTDWKKISKLRRKRFVELQEISVHGGLTPVFENLSNESNPWCFPAYAKDQEEAIHWFDWGWKNNINVHSWPTLREEQILKEDNAFNRWKKLICFPISDQPYL